MDLEYHLVTTTPAMGRDALTRSGWSRLYLAWLRTWEHAGLTIPVIFKIPRAVVSSPEEQGKAQEGKAEGVVTGRVRWTAPEARSGGGAECEPRLGLPAAIPS